MLFPSTSTLFCLTKGSKIFVLQNYLFTLSLFHWKRYLSLHLTRIFLLCDSSLFPLCHALMNLQLYVLLCLFTQILYPILCTLSCMTLNDTFFLLSGHISLCGFLLGCLRSVSSSHLLFHVIPCAVAVISQCSARTLASVDSGSWVLSLLLSLHD